MEISVKNTDITIITYESDQGLLSEVSVIQEGDMVVLTQMDLDELVAALTKVASHYKGEDG